LIQSGLSRKLSQKDIGVPVLRSNNLINNELNLDDISYWYIKDSKGAKIENYFLKENDLLINFINSLSQIGKIALFKNELKRNTIFTTNLLRLNFNSKIYIDFMYFYFQTGKYNNYIQVITKPAVNQASFTTVDLKKFNLKVPSLHEQKKIANFLNSINHKIKLLNKKLGYFKDFKKYCFQNLFSEKLRFKEFIDDWIKIKLGNLVKIYSGKSPKNLIKDKGKFPYFKVEQLNDCSKFLKITPYLINDSSLLIKKGSVIFPKRGMAIMSNKIRILNQNSFMDTNLMALTVNEKMMNNEFLFYLLINERLSRIADTTSIPQLNNKHINPYLIYLPSLKEQEKIANFLSSIDKKIDLTQNQIDLMENFKKGLLQEMFVYLCIFFNRFISLF
jgi:type I restriction enzyme S subunit